jgi:hypothetical protein
MPKIGWVKTTGYLTVVVDGNPIVIKSDSPFYKKALNLVNNNNVKGIQKFLVTDLEGYSKGKLKIQENKIMGKKGETIPHAIARKVVEFAKKKLPFRPLDKFMENLKKNPNKDSRDQLLKYLEHNHFPITSDGCFLAYKYVTKNENGLFDSHTGTFKNNVGCIVAMDRTKCDSNRNVICSSGLHVAAYPYASNCGGGQVIIEVKVNPKDVVAVPSDYNDQKMRVCRYEVIRHGDKEVKESYLGKKFKTDVPKEKVTHDNLGLSGKSAKEIVDLVYDQTGEKITFSLKSKKAILRKAQIILNNQWLNTSQETISLKGRSARDIMNLVEEKTKEVTTLSTKSKKSVLKWAKKSLEDHNFKVII